MNNRIRTLENHELDVGPDGDEEIEFWLQECRHHSHRQEQNKKRQPHLPI